jgi:hypothetical protein
MAIAAAAMVAGSLMQSKGQADAIDAEQRAVADNTNAKTNLQRLEWARQDALQRQATGQFDKQLAGQGADSQQQKLSDAIAARKADYEKAITENPAQADYLPGQSAAPKIIQDQVGKSISDAIARARSNAANKAALEGFGDLQTGNQISNARSAQDINMFGGFRRGSNAVLPIEADAADQELAARRIGAARKGQGMRTLGGMLQMGGQLYGMGAAANGGGWTSWLKGGGGSAPVGGFGGASPTMTA